MAEGECLSFQAGHRDSRAELAHLGQDLPELLGKPQAQTRGAHDPHRCVRKDAGQTGAQALSRASLTVRCGSSPDQTTSPSGRPGRLLPLSLATTIRFTANSTPIAEYTTECTISAVAGLAISLWKLNLGKRRLYFR